MSTNDHPAAPAEQRWEEVRAEAQHWLDERLVHRRLHSAETHLFLEERIIRDLLALADEWRRVVERLPRTADGKVITVGSEVWLNGFTKYPGYVEYIMDDLVAVNDMSDWPAAGCDTIREYTVRHPSTLYSTREAALAARESATLKHSGKENA